MLSCIVFKDCGVQRVLITINLIAGVIFLSKPPLLFSANENNITNTLHHHNDCDHDHDRGHDQDQDHDHQDGGYDVIGVVAALAVPTISAFIDINVR